MVENIYGYYLVDGRVVVFGHNNDLPKDFELKQDTIVRVKKAYIGPDKMVRVVLLSGQEIEMDPKNLKRIEGDQETLKVLYG